MIKGILTLLVVIFLLTACAAASPEPANSSNPLAPTSTSAQAPSASPEPTPPPTQYVPSYPDISADSLQQGQTPHAFLSSSGVEVRYLLYVPEDYDPAKEWPLIVFLHGRGSDGDDLESLFDFTPVDYGEDPEDFPFILISPQLPSGYWGKMVDPVNELLDHIIATLAVDTTRLYLTGFSNGGHGTWLYALKYPERFAAMAPVAGAPTTGTIDSMPDNLCILKEMPIWIFHGADDKIANPELDIEAVAILEACDANVQLTLYPDTGHDDAWIPTYGNPAFYEWLLQHSK
jgi:predicted peptidase